MIKSSYSPSRWWENELSSIRDNFMASLKAMICLLNVVVTRVGKARGY